MHSFSEKDGKVISTVSVKDIDEPAASSLKEDEVLVKILAQPVNPTDIIVFNPPGGSMQYKQGNKSVTQEMIPQVTAMYKPLVGKTSTFGSEACGRVIATGSNAKDLDGKIVSLLGGPETIFGQKVVAHKLFCFVHNDGVDIRQAAASLVNPLTAVSLVEQAKADGHSAMVHTAAASNLGKMLVKYCKLENFPLVCVVRKDSQVKELQELGAEYALNSTSPGFHKELFEALMKTRATCCFDAVGGGTLGGEILNEMEKAIIANMNEKERAAASKYGSPVKKTLYIYGGLDPSEIRTPRTIGLSFSVEGFLFATWFLRLNPEQRLVEFKKVADNLTTIFKSEFGVELDYDNFVKLDNYKNCVEQKSNSKVLLLPNGVEALN
eukprot:augustus_masked-scaffold_12-processed-gene-0.7-mRNA-1 protein AED:1.00 eAED:1.00 QI:0/-1/0/0/-1/1/1/0/379